MTGDLLLYSAKSLSDAEKDAYSRMYKKGNRLGNSINKDTPDEDRAFRTFFQKLGKMYYRPIELSPEGPSWNEFDPIKKTSPDSAFISSVAFGCGPSTKGKKIGKILDFSPMIVNKVIEVFKMGQFTKVSRETIDKVSKIFDDHGGKQESSWDEFNSKENVIDFLQRHDGEDVFSVIH